MTQTNVGPAGEQRTRAVLFGVNRRGESQLNANFAAVRAALAADSGVFAGADVLSLRDTMPPAEVIEEIRESATGARLLLVYLSGPLGMAEGSPILVTEGAPDTYVPTGVRLADVLSAARDASERVVITDGLTLGTDSAAIRGWLADVKGTYGDKTHLLIGETPESAAPVDEADPFTVAVCARLHGSGGHRPWRRDPPTVDALTTRLARWSSASRRQFRVQSLVGGTVGGSAPARDPAPSTTPTWAAVAAAIARTPVWARVLAVVLVVVVVVALLVVGWPRAAAPRAMCPPPLELRVLSSPEGFPAIAAAAADFAGGRRDERGCRTVHLTVYQGSTDAVLRGFARADGWASPVGGAPADRAPASCSGFNVAPSSQSSAPPDPGRDIGPRPDIWLPDSTVDVDRARCVESGSVRFGDATSVAWSPVVVGVPQAVRAHFPSEATQDWGALRKVVSGNGLDLIRPNPDISTAGLMHTVGLYQSLSTDAGAVKAVEDGMTAGSLPLSDSVDLLCHLASGGYSSPGPVVLVSEATLVTYNVRPDSLPNCASATSTVKFDAIYPSLAPDRSTVLALDHPFVHLTWSVEKANGEQETARAAAVRSFREWLLSDVGQRKLSRFALRPARGGLLDPGSPLVNRLSGLPDAKPRQARTPDADTVSQTIKSYVAAREAGRVVFLVDASWSMNANGNLGAAKSIVESALGTMREQDEAGLSTVPQGNGDSAALKVLVPPHAASTGAAVRAALGRVAAVHNGAALYDAIDRQLSAMAATPGPAKQTLVVIADGEDVDKGGPLSSHTVDALLARHRAGRHVTVQVVALPPARCGPADLDRLATGFGGRCTSTVNNRTGETLVADVW